MKATKMKRYSRPIVRRADSHGPSTQDPRPRITWLKPRLDLRLSCLVGSLRIHSISQFYAIYRGWEADSSSRYRVRNVRCSSVRTHTLHIIYTQTMIFLGDSSKVNKQTQLDIEWREEKNKPEQLESTAYVSGTNVAILVICSVYETVFKNV